MSVGPDYSAVDSQAMIDELVQRGELEKVLLLSREFGGDDRPENVVYLPVGIGSAKETFDRGAVHGLIEQGGCVSYTATPQYEGRSLIPTAIVVRASAKTVVSGTIGVWGKGLSRELVAPAKQLSTLDRIKGLFKK